MEIRSPTKLPGIERLDRGSGIRPHGADPKQSSFQEMLKHAGQKELPEVSRARQDTPAVQKRDGAVEHREKALEARDRLLDQQERADADERRLKGDTNASKEPRERSDRDPQSENRDDRREDVRERSDATVAAETASSIMGAPPLQVAADLAEESSRGTNHRSRGREQASWQPRSAPASGQTTGTGVQSTGATVPQSSLNILTGVDAAGEPGSARSGLDLLNFQEMMDPDLHVDGSGEELLEKLQEALKSDGEAMLDEVGDIVLPQVVRSIAALARSGTNEMRLQLQPPELGELELSIRTTDGVVRGEILVSSLEVKQLLESQMDRLRLSMAASGLELEGIDVELANDSGSEQTRQEFAQERSASSGLGNWVRGSAAPAQDSTPQQLTPSPSTDDQGIEVDVIT